MAGHIQPACSAWVRSIALAAIAGHLGADRSVCGANTTARPISVLVLWQPYQVRPVLLIGAVRLVEHERSR
jgi:hypothetical protein